jgi:hypothetical protein
MAKFEFGSEYDALQFGKMLDPNTVPYRMQPVLRVADLGYLSRIPDPDFYPSLIPDLGSRTQQQHQKRGKNLSCLTIFCSHKYHKIENKIIFEQVKKFF